MRSQIKRKELEEITELLEKEKVIESTPLMGHNLDTMPYYYYVPTNAPADKLSELRG